MPGRSLRSMLPKGMWRMERRSCALVVTGDLDVAGTWMGWLRRTGHRTLGCPGPVRTLGCPHAVGRLCPLRLIADVTVVDATADPSALCARIGGPSVTIRQVERSTLDRASLAERVHGASDRA